MSMTAWVTSLARSDAEPAPELPEVFLLAACHDDNQLGAAGPLQRTEHRPYFINSRADCFKWNLQTLKQFLAINRARSQNNFLSRNSLCFQNFLLHF